MLPPGPQLPAALQTVAYHRDPLGVLRRARARYGPVFTLRLALKGPVVFVAAPEAVARLLASDRARARPPPGGRGPPHDPAAGVAAVALRRRRRGAPRDASAHGARLRARRV